MRWTIAGSAVTGSTRAQAVPHLGHRCVPTTLGHTVLPTPEASGKTLRWPHRYVPNSSAASMAELWSAVAQAHAIAMIYQFAEIASPTGDASVTKNWPAIPLSEKLSGLWSFVSLPAPSFCWRRRGGRRLCLGGLGGGAVSPQPACIAEQLPAGTPPRRRIRFAADSAALHQAACTMHSIWAQVLIAL